MCRSVCTTIRCDMHRCEVTTELDRMSCIILALSQFSFRLYMREPLFLRSKTMYRDVRTHVAP